MGPCRPTRTSPSSNTGVVPAPPRIRTSDACGDDLAPEDLTCAGAGAGGARVVCARGQVVHERDGQSHWWAETGGSNNRTEHASTVGWDAIRSRQPTLRRAYSPAILRCGCVHGRARGRGNEPAPVPRARCRRWTTCWLPGPSRTQTPDTHSQVSLVTATQLPAGAAAAAIVRYAPQADPIYVVGRQSAPWACTVCVCTCACGSCVNICDWA